MKLMKFPLFIILFATVLFSACAGDPEAREANFCDFQSRGLTACDGQKIQVTATPVRRPEQHPRIELDKIETYWTVSDRSWIFISDDILACNDHIVAIGILRDRVGPCDETATDRNQYCGTALVVESYECQ